MNGGSRKCLVVVRGADAGAQLVLDHQVKIVGRARDAQLVLSDGTVSRHHFHVHATNDGVHVQLCAGATPLVHDGREVTEVEIPVGDSLVVGHTVLLVSEAGGAPPAPSPYGATTATIGSLLTGMAAEVRGLASMFALNEALTAADDLASVEAALASWAKTYAGCESIEMGAVGDVKPVPKAQMPVLETLASHGGTRLLVPAAGAPTEWLAFTTNVPSGAITDSLRRLLVLAGALCASRIVQLSRLRTISEDRESFRRQAMGSAHAFLGSSAAAERLTRLVPKLAVSDVTVLLLGETGVGKTFVARLIHEAGPRKDEPLRVINCASIPENLIESELFGHERGAFTGAVGAHPGAFEVAGRGTVLLDEIGELPLTSQAKLLRVLEDKSFERVGSNRSRRLEARIIAATNRDLESMVAAGTFRSDLFFRISVVNVVVPTLRERGDDLVLLAKRILADLGANAGRRIDGFSPEALEVLRGYSWPGNVRELRNAIEHAVALGDGLLIAPSDLAITVNAMTKPMASDEPFTVRLPVKLEWLERRAIEAALQETGGNQTKAAALLGINRNTLRNKMREDTDP